MESHIGTLKQIKVCKNSNLNQYLICQWTIVKINSNDENLRMHNCQFAKTCLSPSFLQAVLECNDLNMLEMREVEGNTTSTPQIESRGYNLRLQLFQTAWTSEISSDRNKGTREVSEKYREVIKLIWLRMQRYILFLVYCNNKYRWTFLCHMIHNSYGVQSNLLILSMELTVLHHVPFRGILSS